MSDTSLLLSLPLMQPAQAQKHVAHNEALRLLDLLVQLVVQDRDRTVPPDMPAPGACHIVGGGAAGLWAGQDGKIALYDGAGWSFVPAREGWRAYVRAEDQTLTLTPDGWSAARFSSLGVNATADATNRLAVSGPATLLNHEGGGHQLKINKAAATDTASLLFQSNWKGMAEMGLAGDDRFAIKVSADGSSFATALVADAATGSVSLPGGVAIGDGTVAAPGLRFAADADTGFARTAADQIAMVAGGAQRALLSKTGLRVDVPLTGTAVTQGPGDTTAGRVTRVGDFGLGGQTADGNSDAAANPTHFMRATSGIRPDESGWHLLHMNRQNGGAASQMAVRDGAATDMPHAAIRHRAATGEWSAWSRLFGESNLLGKVAQANGVPNGAVIERGSNANGEYVRFADGTQMCWRICAVQVGASGAQSFTTAAAFAAGATTSASISHLTSLLHASLHPANIRAYGCSGNAFFLRLITPGTSADAQSNAEKVVMTATGRWF